MASIRKEISVTGSPEQVWEAMRDFNAVHTRVAPGFVVDLKAEPGARTVTFSNGAVARELLVDCDDEARRLVYAIVGGKLTLYSASVQIQPEGQGSRIVWVTDFLPNEVAGYIRGQMDEAAVVMKKTLDR